MTRAALLIMAAAALLAPATLAQDGPTDAAASPIIDDLGGEPIARPVVFPLRALEASVEARCTVDLVRNAEGDVHELLCASCTIGRAGAPLTAEENRAWASVFEQNLARDVANWRFAPLAGAEPTRVSPIAVDYRLVDGMAGFDDLSSPANCPLTGWGGPSDEH